MSLSQSVETIDGIGEKICRELALAGINTIDDLITYFPRSYEDFAGISSISQIKPGKILLKAHCESISTRVVRRGLKVTTASIADDSGKIKAVWFNQPYREKQLKSKKDFYFSGNFEFSYNHYQLTSPSVQQIDDNDVANGKIVPTYHLVGSLTNNTIRSCLKKIRYLINDLPECLPDKIIKSQKLLSYKRAVELIHFPETTDDIIKAKERLAFDELFQIILAAKFNKINQLRLTSWKIPFDLKITKEFVSSLPFKLTDSQKLASWEIIQNMTSDKPMDRLLQGDVGSGKTVVAALAICQAVKSNFQVAFLAPTEILAKQHANNLNRLLRPMGINVEILISNLKSTKRKDVLGALEDGRINVIVGTHALLGTKVIFNRLGLVVIDEQHRFGVEQRQELLKKSSNMPHLLSMTATPIPRSLALTVYGELDISVLKELPAKRKPIITKIWSPNSVAQLEKCIKRELDNGHQAYVVCSLITDNDDESVTSVENEYKHLSNGPFKKYRVGTIHGKLKPLEKDKIMEQFLNHDIDILVSTTVVEVGIDVPNATVMVIKNADHFGLAQLHQLRGRVGRSDIQSYCFLLMSDSQKPSKRLSIIENCNDGFYLAEADLKLRGPGEMYGIAQHGVDLKMATFTDSFLIKRARSAADMFIKEGYNVREYKYLYNKVKSCQKIITLN